MKMDYHVHSISPDAQVPMELMCEAAIKLGLDEIVFTDHYELYTREFMSEYFHEAYLQMYIQELKRCKSIFSGQIQIKSGIELGQIHLDVERAKHIMAQHEFDYIIGSIHKLKNIDVGRMTYTKESVLEISTAYYNQLLAMVKVSDFDCVGHLDLYKRHAFQNGLSDLHERYIPIIKEILKRVIDRNKGIEINTSGLRQNVGETMPSSLILELYRDLGGKIITIGSDAHRPRDIGADFDQTYILLKKCGFNYITTYDKRRPILHKIY